MSLVIITIYGMRLYVCHTVYVSASGNEGKHIRSISDFLLWFHINYFSWWK